MPLAPLASSVVMIAAELGAYSSDGQPRRAGCTLYTGPSTPRRAKLPSFLGDKPA
jgi:hypothetical protein